MQTTYDQFLKTKIKTHTDSGFEHQGGWQHLYPFQEYCVKLALKKGNIIRGNMIEGRQRLFYFLN